jgi:hypothetical protein
MLVFVVFATLLSRLAGASGFIIGLIIGIIICLTFGISFYRNRMHAKKFNSGGWVVTLVALTIVILLIGVSIFYLGTSNPGVLLQGEQCIAASGYLCKNPVYNHSTGNIIVTLGQDTGTNWSTANFLFVPQGTTVLNGVQSISFTSNPANTLYNTVNKGLPSEQNVTVSFPVSGLVNINTTATGTIWVQYTTRQNSTFQYASMALINIKAS